MPHHIRANAVRREITLRSHRAPDVAPLVVPPAVAERMLSVGHRRMYELIRSGAVES